MLLVLLSTFLSPRLAILVWWLLDMNRWESAYSSAIWPVLGFFVVPWTTLMYVLVAPGGSVVGLDWLWLAIALFIDFGSQGWGARSGYRYRSSSSYA